VLAFEAGRKNRIRVNTISAGNFAPQFSISFLSFSRKYKNPIRPKVRASKEYNLVHLVK
jgi:enoyl-[acyl-carrier-protein] reductase (NADH)